MSNNKNLSAYEKFDDFLRMRQSCYRNDTEFDIRSWILENRYARWGIGFTDENLSRLYASQVPRIFPNSVSFQHSAFGSSGKYIFLGVPDPDPVKCHPGAVNVLNAYEIGDDMLLMEQGFVATSHSWSEAYKSKDSPKPCLGYVYDDIANYYMADYPNRLIQKLNSAEQPDAAELTRAGELIARMVRDKISKYNSQPIYKPNYSPQYKRRVLVCDQAFMDASTTYGKLTERHFEEMLLAAIRENPDAQIIVKTHPDTFWEKGKRAGYFNHLNDVGRIKIIRDPINPFCIFEMVDTVYVGSSQMGLEALFAGKKVVVFGAPFYAGWGLTDDRQAIPHRSRRRSLEEVFYYFYIWYTIYQVPGCEAPSTIEDVLDYVIANRPTQVAPEYASPVAEPKISVILPVHGVEKYIDECISSIRKQTLRDIEIILVNDASPDGSQEIIDRHAALDARIRPIVLTENVGQGFARNIGIDAAKGEYIQFLDSDDFLATEMHLENVWNAAIADRADMVRGRKLFERVEDVDGNLVKMRPDWCEEFFEVPFHRATLASHPEMIKGRHFWNWLYRRDFLKDHDIRFLTPQWEEKPFLLKALLNAESISSIDSEGFVYRVRVDSTARRAKNVADVDNQLTNYESQVDMLAEHGAFADGSPLREIAIRLVLQFLHSVIFGFVLETIAEAQGDDGRRRLFDRLSTLLRKTDFDPTEFHVDAEVLSAPHLECGAYPLIYAALVSRRYDYVDVARDRRPVPQEDLIREFLTEPQDRFDHMFQVGLSTYARNAFSETSRTWTAAPDLDKKPRLLIHIGSTKTGSTFIQHFLEHNRAELLRRGVYVPECGLFWQPTRPHKQAGHAQFVPMAVKGKDALKRHIEATLKIVGGRIHTVVLSSEAYFLNTNAVELARQFSDWDVEMICYLRRQDDWANSQYGEFVAGGAVGRVAVPLGDWLRSDTTDNRMNYMTVIGLWESVIGRDKLRIGIYEKGRRSGTDIVSDFLDLAGLADCIGLPRPKEGFENRFPFGNGHVKLIARLNRRHWPDRDKYFNFIEEAGRKVTAVRARKGLPAPKLDLLSREEREQILRKYEASNAIIAKEYLGIASGVLFSPGFGKSTASGDDNIDIEEFDAIIAAFDKWGEKTNPPPRGKQKSGAANKGDPTVVEPKTRRVVAEEIFAADELSMIDIRHSLLFKGFHLVASYRLGKSKLRKLENDPERFFGDSRKGMLHFFATLIRFERRLRHR